MERDLRLEPEHGCWARINWRIEMPVQTDFARLARQIVASGFEARCDCDMLKVLRDRDGHEIILVPRTGRTQIRISTLVPEDERPEAAERLFGRLETCYHSLRQAP